MDAELRITRIGATVAFFVSTVLAMMRLAGDAPDYRGFIACLVGAALFGSMAGYLWRDDLAARNSERIQQKQHDLHMQRQQGAVGKPVPPNSGGIDFGRN